MNRIAIAIVILVLVGAISFAYVAFRQSNSVQITLAGVTLNVEIAKTPADQEKGLSGRDSMPSDHGMLFVFNSEASWTFWMKDMRFRLDIIWFDSQRRVVFAEQNLQPCTPQFCPTYTPPLAAMYVLEVNAGFVAAHLVSNGESFNFLG